MGTHSKTPTTKRLFTLYGIVFSTGAAILVVEIAGMRVLAPYFGNTIYSVSSVLSVILGALSFGYARGGALADSDPSQVAFMRTIWRGGLALVGTTLLIILVLPILGLVLPVTWGPLVTAIILFFLPSYYLGMLSPFAVRLGVDIAPERGVGHLSGAMFFWSTLGSIAGSLGAGFILVPYVGVREIMIGATFAILALGGIGTLLVSKGSIRDRAGTLIMLGLIVLVATTFAPPPVMGEIRHDADGVYERLVVTDLESAGRPARFFLQDHSFSGGRYLDANDHLFGYTTYFELYKLFSPTTTRALFLGGGIGTMPRALHRELPEAEIDVVEIEPQLEEIARTYFDFPTAPNVRFHVADGRRFLQDSEGGYDMIVSDVYATLYSIPSHFTTREFFTLAEDRLLPGGFFMVNVIAMNDPSSPSLLYSMVRTLREVFPKTYVFAVESRERGGLQNFILVGHKTTERVALDRAAQIFATGTPLADLPKHEIAISDDLLGAHMLLTDNFAPVERLVAPLLRKSVVDEKIAIPKDLAFSPEHALDDIHAIVELGPRAVGSEARDRLALALLESFDRMGATTVLERFAMNDPSGREIRMVNVIGRFAPERERRIILGTHYDSIATAYRDPKDPTAPMPGANNGASGVAVVLELARKIASATPALPYGVDVVFFDGEEGLRALGAGDENWYPLGSTHFASRLSEYYPRRLPELAIILDMVCDRDLNIHYERSSLAAAPRALERIFEIGASRAPGVFIPGEKYSIGDDHTPLIAAGIPSLLLIDFDYEPWWNTTMDTPERCSLKSLDAVGSTVLSFLLEKA